MFSFISFFYRFHQCLTDIRRHGNVSAVSLCQQLSSLQFCLILNSRNHHDKGGSTSESADPASAHDPAHIHYDLPGMKEIRVMTNDLLSMKEIRVIYS